MCIRDRHEVGRRELGAAFGSGSGGDRILIHAGRLGQRFDAGLSQQHETGGRGGGEADAHVRHRILEG